MNTRSIIIKKLSKIAIVLVVTVTLQSCYHFRVLNTVNDPASVQYHKKVLWSWFWGVVNSPEQFTVPDCDKNGIDEMRVTTNFAGTLLTFGTLGIVSPVTVQWKCHKPCQRVGGL